MSPSLVAAVTGCRLHWMPPSLQVAVTGRRRHWMSPSPMSPSWDVAITGGRLHGTSPSLDSAVTGCRRHWMPGYRSDRGTEALHKGSAFYRGLSSGLQGRSQGAQLCHTVSPRMGGEDSRQIFPFIRFPVGFSRVRQYRGHAAWRGSRRSDSTRSRAAMLHGLTPQER